jgi:outer membrane protein assembly factor BamB
MLVSLRCTHCGAKLSVDSQLEKIRCEYCATEFLPPKPSPEPAPRPPEKDPSGRSSRGFRLGSLFFLVPLLSVGFVLWRTCGTSLRSVAPGGSFSSQPLLSRPSVLLRALWDDMDGTPLPVTLPGGEVVLGRMRLGSDDQLFIVAADAATAKIRWQIGPLGSYSEGYRDTWFIPTGSRIAVSDFRGRLHLHALDTGAELAVLPLTDRVTHLCPSSEPNEIAVAAADHRSWILDTRPPKGALRDAALPSGCNRLRPGRGEPAPSRRHGPQLPGMRVTAVFVEDELAVAAALKSPGTPLPYAAGFDPKTRAVRWQTAVVAADAATVRECNHMILSAKRFFAVCGTGSSAGWRLIALDAESGTRVWEIELRPLFAVDWIKGLVATANGVYVTRTSSVEIYDPATGKLRGVLGNESYR